MPSIACTAIGKGRKDYAMALYTDYQYITSKTHVS